MRRRILPRGVGLQRVINVPRGSRLDPETLRVVALFYRGRAAEYAKETCNECSGCIDKKQFLEHLAAEMLNAAELGRQSGLENLGREGLLDYIGSDLSKALLATEYLGLYVMAARISDVVDLLEPYR